MEEMWKGMKDSIFGSASKVCGTVKLGKKREKDVSGGLIKLKRKLKRKRKCGKIVTRK